MVARLEQRAGVPETDARPDREAAAETLRDRDDVGAYVVVREPLSGPAHAARHLVEPEQRTVLVRCGTGGGQVALGGHDDASLALDRLEQDRGGLGGHRGGERGSVAVRHELHGAGEGLERTAVRLLGGERQRAHRPPVESPLGDDDVGAAGAAGGFNAASLASVPELVKNTLPSPGARPRRPRRRSASSTCGTLVKKLEM